VFHRTIAVTSPSAPSWSSWPSIALAELPFLAVEDGAGQAVPPLTAVELDEDAPAGGLVVDEGEQV
jgi:hypothetical protein